MCIRDSVNGIYTREPNEEGSEFINVLDAKKLLTFDETSIDLMLPSLLLNFGSDCKFNRLSSYSHIFFS